MPYLTTYSQYANSDGDRDLFQCHEHWKGQQTTYLNSVFQVLTVAPGLYRGRRQDRRLYSPTDLTKLLSLVIVSGLVIGDLLMQGKLLLPGGGVSSFSSHHEMVVFRSS